MIVKRFSGRTAEEALAQAKWELGDEAVILSSGRSRARWWKFWQTGFQVLVATDYPAERPQAPVISPPAFRAPASDADSPPMPALDRIEIRAGSGEGAAQPPEPSGPSEGGAGTAGSDQDGQPPGDAAGEASPAVLALLRKIDDRLTRLEGFSGRSQEEAFRLLVAQGVREDLARAWALELPPKVAAKAWRERLAAGVAKRLPPVEPVAVAGGGRPAVVVVVGPTGSGKTTTIAKLAAHYHLEEKVSVLVITTDTYRVGAVDQLETFASILRVPFQVARRPKEVGHLVSESDADVILVDTQGHSVHHSMHMAEIRAVWESAGTAEVLLTVPATLAGPEIPVLGEGFLQGEPGRLVITKVDEAHKPGPLIGALTEVAWPLAYVTNGQSVPEDIQAADAGRLARWLVEGRYDG